MRRPSGTSATPARATDSGAGDRLRRAPDDGGAAEPDVAPVDGDEAHDRVQRRRLPGPVRADQPDDLAALDVEVEVVDRGEAELPEFAAAVKTIRDDHSAGVLLIDHNMALIMEVCDRIHVLDQGRTLAQGTPAEVRQNIDVANAYLGGSGRDV